MSNQYERSLGLSGLNLTELRALLKQRQAEAQSFGGAAIPEDLAAHISNIRRAIRFWEDTLGQTKPPNIVGGKL